MDFIKLQKTIVACVVHSYIPKSDKLAILYYLFYQLCWDFDIESYLKIDV